MPNEVRSKKKIIENRLEKAFIVQTDDPEESVVRFATTNVAARREGANEIGTDFNMVSCKRLPWADKFVGGRVPESAYIENGWWFECATCSERVNDDTTAPVFALDLVFCCEKCHCAEVADRNAAEARKQEIIESLLAKFPGVEVTYASKDEVRRVANFKFPGGNEQATWVLGEDTVSVATRDVDAWNVWREPFRAFDQIGNHMAFPAALSILRQSGTSHKEPVEAYQYAVTTDTPIASVSINQLEDYAQALRQGATLPIGTVEFLRKAMAISGIVEPDNLSYPEVLRPYLCRQVKLLPAGHVLGHWFIKPTTTKAFTGIVVDTLGNPEHLDGHDRIQYQAFLSMPPEEQVWVAEPVTWLSEYRYYVIDGQVRGNGRYDGATDDMPIPNRELVSEMASLVAREPNAPVAFSLDVGVLNSGETALIECNDAWALGLYKGSMARADYIEMLWRRWSQLHSTSAKQNTIE